MKYLIGVILLIAVIGALGNDDSTTDSPSTYRPTVTTAYRAPVVAPSSSVNTDLDNFNISLCEALDSGATFYAIAATVMSEIDDSELAATMVYMGVQAECPEYAAEMLDWAESVSG